MIRGTPEDITQAIKFGTDVNIVDESNGYTALIKASEMGRTQLVNTLLKAGADVNFKNFHGRTALMNAASMGHVEVVKALLKAGAKVNDEGGPLNGDSCPLILAVGSRNAEIVKILLNAGAYASFRAGGGVTAQTVAERMNEPEIAAILAKAEADERAKGIMPLNKTQFLDLCKNGELQEVIKAVNARTDVNAKRQNVDETALSTAAQWCHTEIVKVLLKAGANVNERTDKDGSTALMSAVCGVAAIQGRTDVITALVEAGADVNARTNKGFTALMYAAIGGHAEAIIALIEAGADVNVRDRLGRTALDYARENPPKFRSTNAFKTLEQLCR